MESPCACSNKPPGFISLGVSNCDGIQRKCSIVLNGINNIQARPVLSVNTVEAGLGVSHTGSFPRISMMPTLCKSPRILARAVLSSGAGDIELNYVNERLSQHTNNCTGFDLHHLALNQITMTYGTRKCTAVFTTVFQLSQFSTNSISSMTSISTYYIHISQN